MRSLCLSGTLSRSDHACFKCHSNPIKVWHKQDAHPRAPPTNTDPRPHTHKYEKHADNEFIIRTSLITHTYTTKGYVRKIEKETPKRNRQKRDAHEVFAPSDFSQASRLDRRLRMKKRKNRNEDSHPTSASILLHRKTFFILFHRQRCT